MSGNKVLEELQIGNGNEEMIQFLHANAHVPETYSKFLKALVGERYTVHLPLQRPLWRDSDPAALRHWSILAQDIISHMDAIGRKGVIGMGHSLGAIVTWLAAVERPDLFSQVILIDPVVLPYWLVQKMLLMPFGIQRRVIPIVQIAFNRRDTWPNRGALNAHLGSKKVFKRMDEEVWEDFVQHAVTEIEGQGIQLRYPRYWEARIYASAPNLWPLMSHHPCPITIIKAAYSDVITPRTWQKMKRRLPQAKLIEMKDVGHLLPFEKPLSLAQMITEILDSSANKIPT